MEVSDHCLLTLSSVLSFQQGSWCLNGRNDTLSTLLNYKRIPPQQKKNQGLSYSILYTCRKPDLEKPPRLLKENASSSISLIHRMLKSNNRSEEEVLMRICYLLSSILSRRYRESESEPGNFSWICELTDF